MSDQFEKWQRMLAGETVEINPNPEDAIPGFFRSRKGKNGPFEPVSIFYGPDGKLTAVRNGDQIISVESVWPWCAAHPIKYEEYERVADRKENWSDQDASVEEARGIGDNSIAAGVEPHVALLKEIEIAEEGVARYGEIKDDETENRAQSLRSLLLELSRKADNTRTKEKAPHLEEAKRVDGVWMPLVKRAKEAADKIRDAMSAWETKKAKAQAEADAAAAAARETATDTGAPTEPLPDAPIPPRAMAQPIRGAHGRAASVKAKKVAVIEDQDKVYEFMKMRPEVREVLQLLAQRAVDAGTDVPGVTVDTQRRVA